MSAFLQHAALNKPDILSVMEREGIELKRRGRDFWAPCPFHADKTPSFKVSPERQAFYCFSCGEHGDAVDFIQKRHSVNFKEALNILGIRSGRPLPLDPAIQRQKNFCRPLMNGEKIFSSGYQMKPSSFGNLNITFNNFQKSRKNSHGIMLEQLADLD